MNTIKRLIRLVLPTVAVAALMFASCTSKDNVAKVIPENAMMVANIDGGSIWVKGDMANLGQMRTVQGLQMMLQQISPDMAQLVNDLMSDPSSCGLDLARDITIFSATGTNVCITTRVKSQKNLEAFLTKLSDQGILTVKSYEQDGLKMANLENDMVLASNGKRAIIGFNTADGQSLSKLAGSVAALFSLDKDHSMADNDDFSRFWSARKDISFFFDYNGIFEMAGDSIAAIYDKEDVEELKEAAMAFHGSFEKGAIEITAETYGMPDNLLDMADKKFNESLLTLLPEETLICFTAGADLERMLKYFEKRGMLDQEELTVGTYDLEDIAEALGGSMALNFYGFRNSTPLVAAALDVKDRKVVEALLAEIGSTANGSLYEIRDIPMSAYLNDKALLFSTDASLIDDAAKNISHNGLKSKQKAAKGQYFFMDLNLNHYPTELVQLLGLVSPVPSLILSTFDYMEFENISPTEGRGVISMSDKNTNALASILQLIDKVN